ncbi:UNKNOWN [Stylonychia lemnae]|uniref:Transmembrane protein n=1 Tax=Stylonychia lemnae TaxID=5949 RepID=A0A077ZY21_STYLE|nr:UNKNOWN [Stylonychia lemnae]|eukprot:CDW74512.1 UNKNOWN [Stylonychia lemnae]
MYIFLFFMRRFLYGFAINFFGSYPFIQVFMLCFSSLALLIFQYCYFPFDTKNQQFFEIYNETTILLVSELRTNLGWVIVGIIGINIFLNQLNLVVSVFLAIYILIKRILHKRMLKKLNDEKEKKNASYEMMNLDETKSLSQNISLDLQTAISTMDFDDGFIVNKPKIIEQQAKQKVMNLSQGRKFLQQIKNPMIPRPTKIADQIKLDPELVQGDIEMLKELNKSRKDNNNNIAVQNVGQFSNVDEIYDDFDNKHQDLLLTDFCNHATEDLSFQQEKQKSQLNLLKPIMYQNPKFIANNKILKIGRRLKQ